MKKMFLLIVIMILTVLSLQVFADEKPLTIEIAPANQEIIIDQIESATLILHAASYQESTQYVQNLEEQVFLLTQTDASFLKKGFTVASIMGE